MKIIICFFLVYTTFVTNLFAEQDISPDILKDYYNKRLQEANKLPPKSSAEDLNQAVYHMMTSYMINSIKNGWGKKFEYEKCSDWCTQYGTGSLQQKAVSSIPGVELSNKTKDCQKNCKAYKQEVDAFIDGVNVGYSGKNSNETCAGNINSSSRTISKPRETLWKSIKEIDTRTNSAPK